MGLVQLFWLVLYWPNRGYKSAYFFLSKMNSTNSNRYVLCPKVTTSLKTLDVWESWDGEPKPLFSVGAAETAKDIRVTENLDAEIRRNPTPTFFFPGRPRERPTRFCSVAGAGGTEKVVHAHPNYISQVATYISLAVQQQRPFFAPKDILTKYTFLLSED